MILLNHAPNYEHDQFVNHIVTVLLWKWKYRDIIYWFVVYENEMIYPIFLCKTYSW